MTTVASTLKIFDSMTRPLQSITQGMNIMISTMQDMQKMTNKNVNVDKSLIAAKHQIASAEIEIARTIKEAENAQKNFNNSVQRSSRSTSNLLSSVKQIVAAYLSFQAARTLTERTIGGAMAQQQMVDTFSARAGSEGLGKGIYDAVVKQALALRQDVDASLAGTMSFMSNTTNVKQLTQLNKLAMRLAKLNPTEGLQGAAFSLKELMSGDYTSIAERFNISRSMLQDSAARKAGLAGNIEGFIKGMEELLNKQRMTEEAFEKMLDSPAAKWSGILNAFKHKLAGAGQSALKSLEPLIDKIDKAFQYGGVDAFFNSLSRGLVWAANSAYKLYSYVYAVSSFISRNWGIIEPMIW